VQADDADLEEVVVTGSRIIRDGTQAPTPVTVIAAEQLQVQSPRSLAEGVVQLPVFRGSTTTNNGSAASGGSNQAGSFLNLRGLGVNRTLVLLDGRRLTPSATSGASDINLIPQGLVQRVDVVTGGASAAYGSDAVAGVVNFVLDSDFTGLKGLVQGGISHYGDVASYKVSLTWGRKFADGRGQILLSGLQTQTDPVYSELERDWGRTGVGLLTFPGRTPSNLILPNVNQLNYPGGVILSGPLAGTKFLPGGVPAPYDFGDPNFRTTANIIGGDGTRNYVSLASLLVQGSVFGRVSYEVSDTFKVFGELSFGETHNRYGHSTNGAPAASGQAYTIFSGNPFIPAATQAEMTRLNLASFQLSRVHEDWPRVTGDILNDSFNAAAGFNGEFAGWKYDAYYAFGDNRTRTNTEGNQIFENVYAAVDAVRNPANGEIVCRVTLTNPGLYPGCVPLNPFGSGSPSQAAIEYAQGTAWYRHHTTQHVAAFNISGEPFSLWAGPVGFATGAEFRNLQVDQLSDPISQEFKDATGIRGFPSSLINQRGGFSFTNQQPLSGEVTVKEGYVEAVVPLAKDLPWAVSLEVNGAARYTHYSTSGGVVTWKAGVSYRPIEPLRLRGTISRDIRAPSITELFQGNAQGQGTIRDTPRNGAAYQIFTGAQGNANLQVEEADTWTAGVVYQPAWLPGFSASIDYYDISIAGAIGTLTAQQTADLCAGGSEVACGSILRGPDDRIQRILLPFLNLASLKTSGWDFEFSYSRDLELFGTSGRLGVRALASHLLTQERTVPGAQPIDTAGEVGLSDDPEWTGLFAVSYDLDRFSVSTQTQYISGGLYNKRFVEGVDINENDIPERWYTDLSLRYRFGEKEQVEGFFTVNNLFNQDPPLIPNLTATLWIQTNKNLYDSVGRYYTAGVRFRF
jgi:outer membrane receptor protein involved in Fe transport